jgi:hypothetical protein
MAKTFRIATIGQLGELSVIGEKSKVSEELFRQILHDKISQLTKDHPDKYDELKQKVDDHLLKSNQSISICDTWFEAKDRK